eukprot:144710-Chlamydomonas_euryale.AAC.1
MHEHTPARPPTKSSHRLVEACGAGARGGARVPFLQNRRQPPHVSRTSGAEGCPTSRRASSACTCLAAIPPLLAFPSPVDPFAPTPAPK